MHQRSYAGCAFILNVYKLNTGCAKWPADYFRAAKNETMLLTFMQFLLLSHDIFGSIFLSIAFYVILM